MKQQSSRFTVPSWLRWVLLIIGIVIIISGSTLTWMYVQIEDKQTEGFTTAKNLAVSETKMTKVTDVLSYNGENPIHIVRGQNANDEELVTFLNLGKKEVLTTIKASSMIPTGDLKAGLQADCSACSFIDVQLAYEENSPAWELTYIDENQRYVLEYVRVTNGDPIQRFAFRQP
ncbi:DUF5590 domain-containing protein [Halobacillus shinanisalinarum]|uniref:DUF5590 domain-containing protein n=1 Tax=Halobacillus shinanisalinarum TaxID=2932258 RepID=A0ABY4GZC4_9BACI|nr:DUF5590 domain-containing protein [Halobacillus shinanisalinarum]UOQ93552.1 DUF5590 domain-containing protein [Halobacillus shinanisalinarum]